jgi:hypothetical protein
MFRCDVKHKAVNISSRDSVVSMVLRAEERCRKEKYIYKNSETYEVKKHKKRKESAYTHSHTGLSVTANI